MRKPIEMPALSFLEEVFSVRDDGALIWSERPRSHFKSDSDWLKNNRKYAGCVAGTVGKRGYVQINLAGRQYLAHRVVFFMFHELLSVDDLIDHFDGNTQNNRPCNLRPADHAGNMQNSAMRKCNRSGVKGVAWNARSGKWLGRVEVKAKVHWQLFDKKEEAADWVRRTRRELHGEFRRDK